MTQHTTPSPVTIEEIGPLARLLRKERGLTLDQASAEIGATISALSRAERGEPGVYRLALRSANAHLEMLAAAGHYLAGRVEERIQAVGGALSALTKLRGPETDRRAALLRQAFLARGVRVERVDQHLCVRLADATVAVDLPTMEVFAWLGRANANPNNSLGAKGAGAIVEFEDQVEGLSADAWALVIDRFAAALVVASTDGPLDLELFRREFRGSPPSGSPAGGGASPQPGAPMGE